MRILFFTSLDLETGGGSVSSTEELAGALGARGHGVALLGGSSGDRRKQAYKRTVNLATKAKGARSRALIELAVRQPGRLGHPIASTSPMTRVSPVPENALDRVLAIFPADVVIASGLARVAWRRTEATLRRRGVPVVLYLRESVALPLLAMEGCRPDLLLANAESLSQAAREMGFAATTVPSVVDVAPYQVDSTRSKVLFVNPTPARGLDTALALAARQSEIPFAFLESNPLEAAAWRALEERVKPLGNVELRRRVLDRGRIYADARVLLVPYQVPNRPRVVLEAQANGIPVLASRLGDLIPAVGPGGLLVPADAPVEEWSEGLSRLWDPETHESFSRAAREHAARPEVQPAVLAKKVEQALFSLVGRDAHDTPAAPLPNRGQRDEAP